MEKDVLRTIKNLKEILEEAENTEQYDVAKKTAKELFRCYLLLENLQKNYSIADINTTELAFFDKTYEEEQADTIRRYVYEFEHQE